MEVVYTGLHRTPDQIVSAAVQEDVDVVGISLLSGAHMSLVPRIVAKLRASGAGDVSVVIGGVIPDEDIELLRHQGVADVFPQDTPPDVIVTRIRELAAARPLE
jgi:methylmalonyl-CoA mutase C-terminal domain/subunit